MKLKDIPALEWHSFKVNSSNVRKYLNAVIDENEKLKEAGSACVELLREMTNLYIAADHSDSILAFTIAQRFIDLIGGERMGAFDAFYKGEKAKEYYRKAKLFEKLSFDLNINVRKLEDVNKQLQLKYSELIMAVGNKYKGETRHETALRYIKNAERVRGKGK